MGDTGPAPGDGGARAHFDFAMTRAREYLDMGDAVMALSSLISDLSKHEGTAGILHPDLVGLAIGEYAIGGDRALRRFLEGIPAPPAPGGVVVEP